MFDNVGGKIKALVKIVFIISCIGAGIAVFISFIGACGSKDGSGWAGFFIALLSAVAVVFFSWIGSFVLYGYGEMVENSGITQYYTKKIYEELQIINNEEFKWFELLIACIVAWMGYQAPIWMLIFQKILRKLEMEN